jgi:hypothetical protein
MKLKRNKKQVKGFPINTKVLAPSGYILMKDVKVGQEVFCHNTETGFTELSEVTSVSLDEQDLYIFYKYHLQFVCCWNQTWWGYNHETYNNGGTWQKKWMFLDTDSFTRFSHLQLVSPLSQNYIHPALGDLEQIRNTKKSLMPVRNYNLRRDNCKIDIPKYYSKMDKQTYEKCAIIAQLSGDQGFFRGRKFPEEQQRPFTFCKEQFIRLNEFRVEKHGIDHTVSLTTKLGTCIIWQNNFFGITGAN